MTKEFHIETGNENTTLRTKSATIKVHEIPGLRSTAQDMVAYIRNIDHHAAGLAAPQIGINKRLIAVSLLHTYSDEVYRSLAMINPEILEHSKTQYLDEEGCLSVPGQEGSVLRYDWIKLRYTDLNGKVNTLRLQGLAGRIVQHEIDHLDGILFTDKVEETAPLFAL